MSETIIGKKKVIKTAFHCYMVILCFCVISSLPAHSDAGDFIYETDFVSFTLSGNGMNKSLRDKSTGNELLSSNPSPFVSVRKDGKVYPATSVANEGQLLRVEFAQAQVIALYRIYCAKQYIVIELTSIKGQGIDEIQLAQLPIQKLEKSGTWVVAKWNDNFAVGMMALNDCVNARLIGTSLMVSSVYPSFGMIGTKAVIIAVPTSQFLDVVQKIEVDFKLPYLTLSGQWTKNSADVKKSYLFTDLTEKNVDETIRYAKLANIKYILIYNSTWSSTIGSYPINMVNYPNGEAGLKATIDKCHAAGIKVGLHMLTSLVGKNDKLAQPIPNPHLLKETETVLTDNIDAKTESISIKEDLINLQKSSGVNDFQIDNEIVRCRQVEQNKLLNCVRGFSGQKASIHNKGSKVYKLFKTGELYFVDLKSPLKNVLSERIAGVINRNRFDMIYFDGGELNRVNDPYWYWGGQQQIDILTRIKRDILVQGSGWTPWSWHIFARATCDDFGAVASKQFLDYHKIADSWQLYKNNFMPAELGWWGFLSNAPDHPATKPEEAELLGVRALALDAPFSIETSMKALRENGRSDEMLTMLGEYEKMRISGNLSSVTKERLSKGEWHLASNGNKKLFYPVKYNTKKMEIPDSMAVNNEFGLQPLRFRLQVAASLSKVGDRSNVVLMNARAPVQMKKPAPKDPMPGALAGRIDFTNSVDQNAPFFVAPEEIDDNKGRGVGLNLLNNRAIAVKLRIVGRLPQSGKPTDVINIQLEAVGKMYRDYYIDLDFIGERTIIIPETTVERLLPEFRPESYSFKSSMYSFNYADIRAVNIRWMRVTPDSDIKCSISRVEALKENDTTLKNPTISVGSEKIVIPFEMKTDDYAEFWGDGTIRIFDKNGNIQSNVSLSRKIPSLSKGSNFISLNADAQARVKWTTILFDNPIIP